MSLQSGDWGALATGYSAYLRRRGRSEATVRAYSWGFRDFGRYLDMIGVDVRDLDTGQLEAWQDSLKARGLAPRTQQLGVTSIRCALQWAARRGWELEDPRLFEVLEPVKAPRLLPKPLPPADVDRITAFLTPRRPKGDLIYYRTRAMWFYMVSTGARVAEVLSLDREDLAAAAPIVNQKGGSQKALFAPAVATNAVLDYVRRRQDDHLALWVTHGNPPCRRLEAAGVREQWHGLAERLGVPRFSTHQLRHTCATELLDAGVPPEVVAAHLGHHGLASLAGYGEVRLGRRALAVAAMEARFAERKRDGQKIVAIKGGRGRRVELA